MVLTDEKPLAQNTKPNESIALTPLNDNSQTADFSISIIIPVHNEEKRVSRCLQRTIEFCNSRLWEFEIIIVEDGSTDRTIDVISKFLSKSNRIKLISNREKEGKGEAVRHGVTLAEKKYVAYMDADLSADPAEFERLLPFIFEFDVVIGSRILRGDLPSIKRPFKRSFLSLCYANLFRILFNVKIYDPQCGFKLFRSGVAHSLISQTEMRGFVFDSELLVRASNSGMSIKEVPIIWEHETGSKVCSLCEVRTMGRDLLALWYRLRLSKKFKKRENNPHSTLKLVTKEDLYIISEADKNSENKYVTNFRNRVYD